jgi:hypothetical protein
MQGTPLGWGIVRKLMAVPDKNDAQETCATSDKGKLAGQRHRRAQEGS